MTETLHTIQNNPPRLDGRVQITLPEELKGTKALLITGWKRVGRGGSRLDVMVRPSKSIRKVNGTSIEGQPYRTVEYHPSRFRVLATPPRKVTNGLFDGTIRSMKVSFGRGL